MTTCLNCFTNHGGQTCPQCGYSPDEDMSSYPHALKPVTILDCRYVVGRALNRDSQGITYRAQDTYTKELVRIKEYIPEHIALRAENASGPVYSLSHDDEFKQGKMEFIAWARSIPLDSTTRYSHFEENSTAYLVEKTVQAQDPSERAKGLSRTLTLEEAEPLEKDESDEDEGIHWGYDAGNRILYIMGSGPMEDYAWLSYHDQVEDGPSTTVPWENLEETAEGLVVFEGITHIGDYSFAFFSWLKDVCLSEGIETIGKYAFSNCDFEELRLPDGLRKIGIKAFLYCMLRTVILPESLEVIDEGAFSNCAMLETVIFKGTREQWSKIRIAENNDALFNAKLLCKGESAHEDPVPQEQATCTNCFRDYSGGGACPHCGFDYAGQEKDYPLALRPGTVLGGRYVVGRVLGSGGFGITYVAQDFDTKQLVAIKEFLPEEMVTRVGNTTVRLHSVQHAQNFEYGMKNFLGEAQILSQFNGQANICDIYSYFEENGTAYFAMEYVDGVSLAKYISLKGGKLSFTETKNLLLPVMRTLANVHAKGILHRDVAPDNIMVKPDGSVMLIDFGAARYDLGEKSGSLDSIIKHGFAPLEQHSRRGKQGPFTDVYAMAATIYYALTGQIPVEAAARATGEELIPPRQLGAEISLSTEAILLRAMSMKSADRYQSMWDFAMALEREQNVKLEAPGAGQEAKPQPRSLNKRSAAAPAQAGRAGKKTAKWPFIAAALLAVLIFALPKPKEDKVELPAASATPEPIVNVTNWEYDESSRVLTISGSGEMEEFGSSNPVPWAELENEAEKLLICEGILSISYGAFEDFTMLKEVVLPEGFESIGISAFEGCQSLKEINFPNSLKEISGNAFNDCASLESIKLSKDYNGIIHKQAFYNCTSLKTADLGSADYLGDSVFSGCTALEEVYAPKVDLYGSGVFWKCTSLKKLELGNEMDVMPAFYDSEELETVLFHGTMEDWYNFDLNEEYHGPLMQAEIIFCD